MHFLLQICILLITAWRITGSPAVPSNHGIDHQALEKRDQFIINPCPEVLEGWSGLQFCESKQCGGDTKIRGVCDNIRLNGLQDQRCYFEGGCGSYCRCNPWDSYAPAEGNGPSVSVQYVGIECPATYGLPLQKCSDPKCGGNQYRRGFCDNILVSGAQVPFCPKPGCGIFCQCDPTNDGAEYSGTRHLPEASTIWLTGTTTETVSPRHELLLLGPSYSR